MTDAILLYQQLVIVWVGKRNLYSDYYTQISFLDTISKIGTVNLQCTPDKSKSQKECHLQSKKMKIIEPSIT